MAKPKGGYFKVYRSLWKKDWPSTWRWWWIDMIQMAKWKDTKTLKRGQLAESSRQLAKRWHVRHQTVLKFLQALESERAITRAPQSVPQAHRKAPVITIVNYDSYQGVEN